MAVVVEFVFDGPAPAARDLIRDMLGFVVLEQAEGRHVSVGLRLPPTFRLPKSPPMPVSRVLHQRAAA